MSKAGNSCATVVLVGHCGPDSWLLRNAVARALPEARIIMADDEAMLATHLVPDRLLLVNRILGGDFEDERGIELIRRIRRSLDPPRVMLISNYAESQREAVEAGALPGFGKKNVYDDATVNLLRDACSAGSEESKR